MVVATEPYHPAYFMINGARCRTTWIPTMRQYPHQPYNGNPHMHRATWCYCDHRPRRLATPIHEHGNHVRVRLVTATDVSSTSATQLAGLAVYHHDDSGQAMDGIFYWTARG